MYNIITPEQVKDINQDQHTGESVEYILESTNEWTDETGVKLRAVIKQRISAQSRKVEIEGDGPADLEASEVTNPRGFIPIIHFRMGIVLRKIFLVKRFGSSARRAAFREGTIAAASVSPSYIGMKWFFQVPTLYWICR